MARRLEIRIHSYLLVRLFEVFHEDGDHHVDEHELRHEHEDHEENWRYDARHATVLDAVRGRVAVLAQRVLHDAVPVVAGGNAEQREESDAEIGKVSVLAEALARVLVVALCRQNSAQSVKLP